MSKSLTLGSFFDGIGGWLLAAKHAGVKPVWASEIDDFPATVSAHHFPQVTQLGDITKINVVELEPTDIICAGSPCQDLSVAGKREGLAGERSGLFVDAIKLVHGLRERTGKPRYFVWENVPGAFSSNKGMDFRAVLEEISQTEIPIPQGGKWAKSGMVEWNGGSLAWRVLDAQYWGVPQRRKRIFLVAYFGGLTAGEILFERESVCGNPSESEEEREKVAGNAGTSTDCTSYGIDHAITTGGNCTAQGKCYYEERCPTMKASGVHAVFDVHGISCYDMTHADEVMRPVTGDKSNCLNSRMGTGGNQVPVIHSYCIAGNTIDRKPKNGGNGNGSQAELSYTLNTVDRHAVAYSMGHDERAAAFQPNIADNLMASDYKSPPIPFWDVGQTCSTLTANNAGGNQRMPDKNHFNAVISKKLVRRLTTTECERLQGLPDGYTDIEFNGKPAPDSRRYKALGNGMAQPCADYVIKRIVDTYIGNA